MKTSKLCLCGIVWLLCIMSSRAVSPPSYYFEPVVPKNLSRTIEGAGATKIPFGTFPFPNFHECESCRFQQVISASEFSEAPQERGYIYSVLVRGDTCNRDGTLLEGVVIRLSTTAKGPDNLSLKFAENIGPDQKIVIKGFVSVYGGGDCASKPARFLDNWYILSNSFSYSPLKGNLLIDMEYSKKRPDFNNGPTMDAQTELGDGISMIYGCPHTAEVAKEALTTGLIFQFFIVRPELIVKDEGASISLQWSLFLPGFRLQTAEGIGEPTFWKDFGKEKWLNDGNNIHATIDKSALGTTRYFRLFSASASSSEIP
jgi:hypothetical protein